MRLRILVVILVMLMTVIVSANSTDKCPNVKTSIDSIRKRRHLTFPDGTNFVITISLVKAFMTHAPSGWNLALEIDVLFPLPDAKFTNAFFRRKLHHQQKREFWQRLQNAIDYHHINGRACILRCICEAKSYLAPPGKSLVHDLLRVIFTAPVHEKEFNEEVGDVYSEVLDPDFCDEVNDCPISLLNFVLTLNKMKY
ncbi:uncharacterized protein LOC123874334 isoform X1 [Maniola jurtina]|uniref:uncharacterized protein LOC123874334 isoform X1 n=1 Tax=Maniola jurtina TaxID=191418 RepID=UPI001E686E2F|nr:uncharacterized protein LOC123874334 isoform X1 [Maniola jurtina]